MLLCIRVLIAAALLTTAASSLRAYPHALVYFNELAGGVEAAGSQLLHSNLDWGQGLIELDRSLDCHPEWGPIAIAYFGPVNPESLGSRAIPIDWRRQRSPLKGFSHVAVSVNIIEGNSETSSWYDGPHSVTEEFAHFFREQRPIDRLDGSIFIFDAQPYVRFFELNHPSSTSPVELTAAIVRNLPSLGDAADVDKPSLAGLCHVLLLRGMDETGLRSPATGLEALRILTDERLGKAAFGVSQFVRTRSGVRYRLARNYVKGARDGGESHRDQCLCTFATLGLSLAEPLTLESETCQLRDLLLESIANFTFDQRELSWTAQAYAYYLPPARSWTNRFGVTTSFSELLRNIMDRGFVGQSCAGLHAFHAIATIVKADYGSGILDRKTRIAAHAFLRNVVDALTRNQRDDGSWDSLWFDSTPDIRTLPPMFDSQLLITGHMLEALCELQTPPDRRVFVRSTRWLISNMANGDFRKRRISACPLTHALRAVARSSRNQYLPNEFTVNKL